MYFACDKKTADLTNESFKKSFLSLSQEEINFICEQLSQRFGYLIFEKGYKSSVCDVKEKHIVESLSVKQISYTNGESEFGNNIISFSDFSEKRDYIIFNFNDDFIRHFTDCIIAGFDFKKFIQ